MPYDGSGNFSIINNFEEDRINGVSIDSLKMDNNFNDVANGLSNVMLRSGAAAMTGALNMASHKITNVTNGSASKDAVNKGQLDTGLAAKQNTITGGASTIATTNLTANCALVSNASGKVAVLSTVSNTELGYLDGVTSKIQTQLNAKAADNAVVKLTGNQTIAGTKTFSSTISGSINGNAATVTNGVYTTGNQTIGGTKTFSSTIAGSINGNAATVTNGVYTTGNQTIGGTKTFSSSPIVPTLATTDNSTKAASTAWVKSLFTDGWNSTNKSGYTMIADKLIIQRGRETSNTTTGYWDILFETPFSDTGYSIIALSGRTDNVSMYALSSTGVASEYRKTTGCRIMASGVAANVGFDWIAVGYK